MRRDRFSVHLFEVRSDNGLLGSAETFFGTLGEALARAEQFLLSQLANELVVSCRAAEHRRFAAEREAMRLREIARAQEQLEQEKQERIAVALDAFIADIDRFVRQRKDFFAPGYWYE